MKRALVWAAAVRALLGLVAIPLAPLLYENHFLVLVLLRPTKEVLLAAGFLVRTGRVNLPLLVLAAFPLMVLGVWQMYWLGRAYAKEIESCDLPGLGGRVLPAERINKLRTVLRKKGRRVVVLGRLAAFPSALVGAAAGSSGMDTRGFHVADAVGAALALVEVVGAGYLLGHAHDQAGPWVTAVGVATLAALSVALGRWLRRA